MDFFHRVLIFFTKRKQLTNLTVADILKNPDQETTRRFVTEIMTKNNYAYLDIYNRFKEFYYQLIDDNKSTLDNFITIITFHIFTVSFWHEHVGNMSIYVLNPTIIKSKVTKKHPHSVNETQQNYIQNAHLALLTSIVSMPKINEDLHLTISDDSQNNHLIECFKNYQDRLNNLKLNYFSVDLLECSVSL